MKLTREQRKEFKEALLDAFSKKQLEMMLSEELDWELNTVAGGSNDSEIVFDLIKYAIKEGKLEELLKAAILRNSGNAKLKRFHDNLYANTVTEEEIYQLQQLLNKIDKNDFKVIRSAYLQVLPENFKADNQSLCNPVDSYTILKILRAVYTKNDNGVPSIVELVKKIANKLGKNHPMYPDLVNWLTQLEKRLKITISLDSENQTKELKSNSRLVCVIYPEKKGFCLEAISITDKFIKNLDYLKTESEDEARRGIFCNSVEEICTAINKVIINFLENVSDFLNNLEIYLPYNLIYTSADNWCLLNDYDEAVPILQEHKVIVHTTDRVRGRNNFNYLHQGWERLTDILQQKPSADIFTHIELSNHESDWNIVSGKLRKKIGIKLAEPLTTQSENFIKAVITAGVPLAFWIKCEPSSNINLEQIDKYLTVKYLENNLEKLIQQVCQMRYDAYNERDDEELAYHLGFLCDIPDKIREIRPLFKQLNL